IKRPHHPALAICKDETGRIHAVSPVCTHLKCIVQWNKTEKTWDCPCHGARYSIDGKVLTGPSTIPLTVIPAEIKELNAT
ncbi:MAG TPA: Rieske 2Fe-2S domain-containing protein, partial [Puia sp.]|nr:Rieske 2Fe-2S domain-containing protein [Puia sp.]